MRCITYRFFFVILFFINIGFNNNCLVCVHGSFILRPKTFGGYLDYKMSFLYRIFLLVMPLAKHVFILYIILSKVFFIDIYERLHFFLFLRHLVPIFIELKRFVDKILIFIGVRSRKFVKECILTIIKLIDVG